MTHTAKYLWSVVRSGVIGLLLFFLAKAGAEWYLGKQLDDYFGYRDQPPQEVRVSCEVSADAVTTAYAKGVFDGQKMRFATQEPRRSTGNDRVRRSTPKAGKPDWPSRYVNCLVSGNQNCNSID